MAYLLYDADCGFCASSAHWIARRGGVRVRAWQEVADLRSLGLTKDMVMTAAYWVADDRRLFAGAEAIACALTAAGGYRRVLGRTIRSHALLPLAHRVYAWVAVNRSRMPGSTSTCAMPPEKR